MSSPESYLRTQLLQRLQGLHRAGVLSFPRPIAPKSGGEHALVDEKKVDSSEALQALNEQVCQCTRCPDLVKNRTRTVFGVGNARPRLCFFGEGPGADEDRLGEPFVGAAGRLLNKIIAAMGLRRDEVYILNVVKCRPPGNRTPSETEIDNCRPFFQQQLSLLQPEFICCLGACAAQTLLQSNQSVARLRQQFHQYEDASVIVTYHPAYLLRRPEEKTKTWSDMKMLMRQMGLDVK